MASLKHSQQKVPLWNSLPTHMEARERLNYVAECRGIGLLTGPAGTGKSRLFCEVQEDLELKGEQVVRADLSGWGTGEFAAQIALKLQLGLNLKSTMLEVFTRIEQWALAMRQLNNPPVILLDHVDRSVDCHSSLDRLLGMLSGSVACLMACTDPIPGPYASLFQRHCPLNISLPRLSRQETARYVSLQAIPQRHVSPNGLLAIQELSNGQIRSLDRLSGMILQASEDDETELIDSRLVRESAKEVRL